MKFVIWLWIVLGLIVGCKQAEEHGHAHGDEGATTVKKTIWTDDVELFVEFPPLVKDKISRFATHVTLLDGHQPLEEGEVTVSLVRNGKGIRHRVEVSENEGLFLPALQPGEEGVYSLYFDISSPQFQDRLRIDSIKVYATVEEASAELVSTEDESTIDFGKAQAWNIDFQTQKTSYGSVFNVIRTSGVWMEAPGTSISISANVDGIVNFHIPHLTEGTVLNKGDLILSIKSGGLTDNNLKTDIDQALADYEQAESEYNRNKELFKSKIVSEADLERVENRFKVAKSTYENLMAGYAAGGKQIRAPFQGFVKEVMIENGAFALEGSPLLVMGNLNSRLLDIQVSPDYASQLDSIQTIWYKDAHGNWHDIKESEGEVTSVSRRVDREDPLISVFARVNDVIEMPEGSFTEVQIATGKERPNLTVPRSALLEDYGNYSVIVQLQGETFERRPVILGRYNGEYAEVIRGLEEGEVIVTRSAYQVKMASMLGQTPAHGHTH